MVPLESFMFQKADREKEKEVDVRVDSVFLLSYIH